MTRTFNRTKEREKRRKLRSSMTHSEKLLWEKIRKRQIKNKRFLRQFSVLEYVIDFYCPDSKLAIEVDGDIYNSFEEIEYDKERQTEIENFGIRFLRIKNEEVLENMNKVILKIEKLLE